MFRLYHFFAAVIVCLTIYFTLVRMNSRVSNWGLPDPTLLPCMTNVRIRNEHGSRDSINSRAWDFFHATPPAQIHSEEFQKRPIHMDMKPINSRTNTVQYRIQPQYMPDPVRAPAKANDLEVAPVTGPYRPPPTSFSANTYTQRLDASGSDSRNMIRELRGAVVEDNRERQVDASRHLLERQFYDRWLPAKASAEAASLQAYELLRPKQDNWREY
jgi:hypothetical protein